MTFGKMLLAALATGMISSASTGAGLAPTHAKPQGLTIDPDGSVKTSTAAFQWGDDSNALLTGFDENQVGKTLHLHCDASAGCVVFVQATMQITSAAVGDSWGICAEVDDHFTNPIQCFSADTQITLSVEGVYHGSLQVKKGSHDIRFFVQTSNAATLNVWHEAAQMLQ